MLAAQHAGSKAVVAGNIRFLRGAGIRRAETVFQWELDRSEEACRMNPNDPVRVVEAEAFWQPGTKLTQDGDFRAAYRDLGTVPAQRVRLPVPGSTWKLTGRVGRTDDGTIYAGFGPYLHWSKDEGKTWDGKALEGLPGSAGERVIAQAFGAAGRYIYLAHFNKELPCLGEDCYPIVISRSKDGGKTWESNLPLDQGPYKYMGGDGDHIIALEDGTLLATLDAWNPATATSPQVGGMVLSRSTDQGRTWGDSTIVPGVAETGLLCLGGQRLLAAMRTGGPGPDGKTVRLANSDDGGRTWRNFRPLTHVYGQAHGDLAALPGGGVVAVYENRYPFSGTMHARVSWDGGESWEPELYIVMDSGVGYPGSVAVEDGTVVTVAGDGELTGNGEPTGRGYTLQAMRWKPWPK